MAFERPAGGRMHVVRIRVQLSSAIGNTAARRSGFDSHQIVPATDGTRFVAHSRVAVPIDSINLWFGGI
jgi:hypothetical protein